MISVTPSSSVAHKGRFGVEMDCLGISLTDTIHRSFFLKQGAPWHELWGSETGSHMPDCTYYFLTWLVTNVF